MLEAVGSHIQIRRLGEGDGPAFFRLRRQAIRVGCAAHYPEHQLAAWTDPQSDGLLQDPLPGDFYCATIQGELVGSGMLGADTGRIEAMFVLPAHFGRGIGRAMMRHLEGIARKRAIEQLTLDATLNAVRFYRAQGFAGEARGEFRSPRGVTLECVPMSKSIGA